MRFEFFIAFRYLLARRKQTFISVISFLSIAGVALGVAALIVVLGVMTGFSENLREKILGMSPHVIVSSYEGFFSDYRLLQEKIAAVSGVSEVTPFLYTEVMLSSSGGVKGAALRGIDPHQGQSGTFLEKHMVSGNIADLAGENTIIIGKEMARRLGVQPGARINVLTSSGMRTAAGFRPRIMSFIVVGVFKTGMFEYDSSLVYASVVSAQKVLGLKSDMIAGLELRLQDIDAVESLTKKVEDLLPPERFYIRNWMEMNQNLFSALKLEKAAMGVILAMIVLVASFSIVTALVMLVMEKTKDIALLLSIGATAGNIRRIFIWQGMLIGGIGTTLGYVLGLGIAVLLQRYQFIKLPAGVYYLDHIPMLLRGGDLFWIGFCAFVLCFLATLYPSRQAASLNPSEALRYE